MGSRIKPPKAGNRLPLVIGLVVVATGALAWSLFASAKDPSVPTAPAAAGSSPEYLTPEEKAFLEKQKGAHTP